MSAAALVFVLTGSVLHAAWNLAAKLAGGGQVFVAVYTAVSLAICLPAGAAVAATSGQWPDATWWWAGAVSGALHVGYALALQHSYAVSDLNLSYPVSRGVGPLLTLMVAVGLLGEHIAIWQAAGALGIVAGVMVLSSPGRRPAAASASPETHGSRRRRAGLQWGVITGIFIAGYTLFDDHAVTDLGVPPLPYYALSAVLQTVLVLPIIVRQPQDARRVLRRRWRPVIAVAVLMPVAYVLALLAMQSSPVALVAPLRSTSLLVTAVLGWLVLREPAGPRRLFGAGVVLAGIGAVAIT